MKTITKLNLAILFLVPQLDASQALVQTQIQGHCTYHGYKITPTTILALAPQVPEELQKLTYEWITSNPEFAATALGYEQLIPIEITQKDGTKTKSIRPLIDATNTMLKQQDTPNLAIFNYVFAHPKTDKYLVKIAGHANRKYNLNHLAQALEFGGGPWGKAGFRYDKALSQADYERFAKELDADGFDKSYDRNGRLVAITTAPKTYQHISRVAYYLLLLETIDQHKLSSITTPATYLVHIPERPEEISDRNYVVIEERLDGLQEIESLSPQEEKELEIVIKTIGLFEISQGNCKRASDGKIVLFDLEQPNNSLPTHFFHLSPERFNNNVREGLRCLEVMKKNLQERQQTLKNLIGEQLTNSSIRDLVTQYLVGAL